MHYTSLSLSIYIYIYIYIYTGSWLLGFWFFCGGGAEAKSMDASRGFRGMFHMRTLPGWLRPGCLKII